MQMRSFSYPEFIAYMRENRLESELNAIRNRLPLITGEHCSGIDIIGDDTGRVTEVIATYVDGGFSITRMQAIPIDSLGYGRQRL